MNKLKQTIKILVLALAGLWATAAFAEPLNTANFEKQITITASGYTGAETLENFPVLVRLAANAPTGFSYDEATRDEIRFADALGNVIPHEIDVWNPDGTSFVWVKLPTLAGTETTFTLYYKAKEGAPLPVVNAQDVWRGAYDIVYHMNEDPAVAPAMTNAAQDAHHASFSARGGVRTDASVAEGGIGKIYDSKGSSNSFKLDPTPMEGTFTISGWFKLNATSGYDMIVKQGNGYGNPGFYICRNSSNTSLQFNSKSSQLNQPCPDMAANWVHFTYLVSGTSCKYYANGEYVAEKASGLTPVDNSNLSCLFAACNTKMDEVRVTLGKILPNACAADWVKAEYDTMTDANFLTAEKGAEDVVAKSDLEFVPTACTASGTTATVEGTLMALGTGAESVTVKVVCAANEDLTENRQEKTVGPFTAAPTSVLATIENLTPGATYFYRFEVGNTAGQTVTTDVQSFTVEDPAILADVTLTRENLLVTVSGSLAHLGVGATTLKLYIGTSATNMELKDTITHDELTEGGTFAFEPQQLPVGDFLYSVVSESVFGTHPPWTTESAPVAFTAKDEATYEWAGGSGRWSDATSWKNPEGTVGALGVPSGASTVVIKPKEDVVVTLTGSVSVKALNFSTKDGAITFKGGATLSTAANGSGYKIDATSLTMDGAANAKMLVFDDVDIYYPSEIRNLDQVEKLVLTRNANVRCNGAITIGALHLNDKSSFYQSNGDISEGGDVLRADKLVVGLGLNRIHGASVFGAYETTGQLGTVLVHDKEIRFTDPSGITLVGDGAFEAGGSRLRITRQFNVTSVDNEASPIMDWRDIRPHNPCTIDAEGSVRLVDVSKTYKQATDLNGDDLDGENVLLTADANSTVALTKDVRVNALAVQNDGVTLDLNGHTLTVASSSLRWDRTYEKIAFVNGTLSLPNPTMLHSLGSKSQDYGIRCSLVAGDNADALKPVFDLSTVESGGILMCPDQTPLATVTGLVRMPQARGNQSGPNRLLITEAPGVFLDFDGPYASEMASFLSSNVRANFKGLGGNGRVFYTWDTRCIDGAVWFGDKTESDTMENYQFVLGENGYLIPGSVDWSGERAGSMIFTGENGFGGHGYSNLLFKAGAKFCVTARADGTCTFVETVKSHQSDTKVTIDGGDVVVRKAGRFTPPPKTEYVVIRSHNPIEGKGFDTVTPGWKLKLSEDKKTLSLVSSPLGFMLIVR